MTSISSVVPLLQPDTIDDPLTAVLRSGACRLLAQAIEAEAEAFLSRVLLVAPWTVGHAASGNLGWHGSICGVG